MRVGTNGVRLMGYVGVIRKGGRGEGVVGLCGGRGVFGGMLWCYMVH